MLKIIFRIVFGLLLLVCGYALYFLRNPSRKIILDQKLFLSPANGKIVSIIPRWVKEPVISQKYKKVFATETQDVAKSGYMIDIMMNLTNVHYQRAPLASKLIKQTHKTWNFFNAISTLKLYDTMFTNEHNEMLFQTKDGFTYKVIQIAGKVARRIVSFVTTWDVVTQWQTIGLIKFWSQVSVLLPDSVTLQVKVGDIVIDGETVLAKIGK